MFIRCPSIIYRELHTGSTTETTAYFSYVRIVGISPKHIEFCLGYTPASNRVALESELSIKEVYRAEVVTYPEKLKLFDMILTNTKHGRKASELSLEIIAGLYPKTNMNFLMQSYYSLGITNPKLVPTFKGGIP